MKQPNSLALAFSQELAEINHSVRPAASLGDDDAVLHVPETGAVLSGLYETIRNASQNEQDNLLLISAIRRFIARYFGRVSAKRLANSGKTLICDLTLAGYLANDSIPLATVDLITKQIELSYRLYLGLSKEHSTLQIEEWLMQPLAAKLEAILRDHSKEMVVANAAYNYFLSVIDRDSIAGVTNDYEVALYMAVQKVLLRSDEAMIRYNLLMRYQIDFQNVAAFCDFNGRIDQILTSHDYHAIERLINRHCAPWRIVLHAAVTDSGLYSKLLLAKDFLQVINQATLNLYIQVNRQIDRGIIRSIAFLIVTKFIIGLAIEIPYDLAIHQRVAWLALGVNLILPPLYMLLLRTTLIMPGPRNTKALARALERIFFVPISDASIRVREQHFSRWFNVLYYLSIIGIFAAASWLLIRFAQFEVVHLIIFFVFISTASFLGFRISRKIRELEVGDEAATAATMLRDAIYMPFVNVGRYLSETYAHINIVSKLLDMLVELPMKTIIAFLRRWSSFISAKKDEL